MLSTIRHLIRFAGGKLATIELTGKTGIGDEIGEAHFVDVLVCDEDEEFGRCLNEGRKTGDLADRGGMAGLENLTQTVLLPRLSLAKFAALGRNSRFRAQPHHLTLVNFRRHNYHNTMLSESNNQKQKGCKRRTDANLGLQSEALCYRAESMGP